MLAAVLVFPLGEARVELNQVEFFAQDAFLLALDTRGFVKRKRCLVIGFQLLALRFEIRYELGDVDDICR
jgi:hypothetical protein